ncbi:MAG: hypothetical protein LUE27_06575 [Clostridia bacterium]|nr:hypothetical protein [Clostridia bacterium]
MIEIYIAALVILSVYVIALIIAFVVMYRQRYREYLVSCEVDKDLADPATMVYDFMAVDISAETAAMEGGSGQITIDDVMHASALNAEVMSKIETNGIDEIRGYYVPKDF